MYGEEVAGAYVLAYNLADIPAVQVGEQVTDVLFASFAQVEVERRRDALMRSLRLLAVIMFPLAVGLAAVAPTIVAAFFKKAWLDIAPMLVLLSALSITRPIAGVLFGYQQAFARPRLNAALDWLLLGTLLGCIFTFGRLGPLWVCVAVGVAFTVRMVAHFIAARVTDGISVAQQLFLLVPPLLACVPMVGAVLGVRWLFARMGWNHKVVQLALETAAGGVMYLGGALLFARGSLLELVRLTKQSLRR
jgi:PST family polysaccharide transporter